MTIIISVPLAKMLVRIRRPHSLDCLVDQPNLFVQLSSVSRGGLDRADGVASPGRSKHKRRAMRSNDVALAIHPATPAAVACRIHFQVERRDTSLVFNYRLHAALNRLLIPPATQPRLTLGLWEHTCFEAFVAIEGHAGYHEFNFSPSTESAVFSFTGYRDGFAICAADAAPRIVVRQSTDELELAATVSLDALSPQHDSRPLRVAAAAVIEAADASLSYWALRHPPGKPDFHHHDAFALRLEAS
jgi:hypothetical protein